MSTTGKSLLAALVILVPAVAIAAAPAPAAAPAVHTARPQVWYNGTHRHHVHKRVVILHRTPS